MYMVCSVPVRCTNRGSSGFRFDSGGVCAQKKEKTSKMGKMTLPQVQVRVGVKGKRVSPGGGRKVTLIRRRRRERVQRGADGGVK